MRTRRLLKLSTLKEAKACPRARRAFKRAFGEQVFVTVKRAEENAEKFGEDIWWIAYALLSPRAQRRYSTAHSGAYLQYLAVVRQLELRGLDGVELVEATERLEARREYRRIVSVAFAREYLRD